ncbi:MAG: LamB/YcsF family protein [Arachnia sp.]
MRLDLNADVGEGIGEDAAILSVVTSANIACGGHAGDARSMRQTLQLAAEHRVAVGAHPSYVDRDGFGRTAQTVAGSLLRHQIAAQLDALASEAAALRVTIGHVKPHGALYHAVEQ